MLLVLVHAKAVSPLDKPTVKKDVRPTPTVLDGHCCLRQTYAGSKWKDLQLVISLLAGYGETHAKVHKNSLLELMGYNWGVHRIFQEHFSGRYSINF